MIRKLENGVILAGLVASWALAFWLGMIAAHLGWEPL